MAFALASSGDLELWDRRGLRRLWRAAAAHPGGIYSVDLGGAAPQRLVASGGDDAAVRVWSARSGRLLAAVAPAHDYIVWAVRLFLRTLVAFSYDCTASVWSVSDGGEDVRRRRTIKEGNLHTRLSRSQARTIGGWERERGSLGTDDVE